LEGKKKREEEEERKKEGKEERVRSQFTCFMDSTGYRYI
jgi:hypothetical protein